MEHNKTSTIALNFQMNVASRTQAQLSNSQRTDTDLSVPHWGNNWNSVTYIWKLLVSMNGAEWIKGICHIWSRGRRFSPSMPEDRYLKLSPQKRPLGRNLEEHRLVRRSATASRGTALLAFGFRMRCPPINKVFTICGGKPSKQWSITRCYQRY